MKNTTTQGIGLKELAFVGYAVTDFAKARKFYGEILGLTETECLGEGEDIGWMEFDIAGQTLALAKAFELWMPSQHGGQACLEVADLDAAVAHLKAHDVPTISGVEDFPHCRLALISDPDGNTLTLHQKKSCHPESAKK